jgi:hypothetical protein
MSAILKEKLTMTVMASVTREIKERRNEQEKEENEPNQKQEDEPNRSASMSELAQEMSHRELTQEEQDSGTRSVTHNSSAELTGKLCQHVMALIRWKVGADKAVMEHMVQALEEWLRRRGISIYTDLL